MPLEPREEKRVADLEERLLALEERNQRLEHLLRSGRAFTNNPLSLSTDLDDLGSVKTFLDFEELAANPDAPAPSVGRLYARGASNDAILRWINESGQAQSFMMWKAADNISVIRGLETVVIANGTRLKTGTVTHSAGWTSTGIVLCTVQDANAFGANERPVTVAVYTVTANAFSYAVDTHANVAANRTLHFGWYADGVI